ncbi:hypothetical protein PV11_04252 [Exophiala sideris]|uniref:Uncharacterized protein n=1 Tax=Exophiala sideris TaxID=1016849 RepID=A0A0D1YH17_9EURO|nr:hypothetical protein PV11_04252 [Exophiala sideris]
MARGIPQFLACIHHFLIQIPQSGYHNISRLIQPQIRSLSEGLTAGSNRVSKDIGFKGIKPKPQNAKERVERA